MIKKFPAVNKKKIIQRTECLSWIHRHLLWTFTTYRSRSLSIEMRDPCGVSKHSFIFSSSFLHSLSRFMFSMSFSPTSLIHPTYFETERESVCVRMCVRENLYVFISVSLSDTFPFPPWLFSSYKYIFIIKQRYCSLL